MNFLKKLGRRWRIITICVVMIIPTFQTLSDMYTTRTLDGVAIVESSRNTGNNVITIRLSTTDGNNGLTRLEEVVNEPHWADLHFGWDVRRLQTLAATLAAANAPKVQGNSSASNAELGLNVGTVRLSGWSGEALITAYNPNMPSWLINTLGWFLKLALVLLVFYALWPLTKLLWKAVRKMGFVRKIFRVFNMKSVLKRG